MRYFMIDEVATEECEELYEYQTEKEFIDDLLFNREIAKEQRDTVETLKEIRKTLKSGENCSFSFNAFSFIKGEELLEDFGYIKGQDY